MERLRSEYAHKPWGIQHDGLVDHFYCAVGDQGRVIALATAKKFRKKQHPLAKHRTPTP